VVNNRVERRGRESDNYKIKDMMIAMSRKGNVFCEIGRIKSRYELLDLRVIWMIKVKIEITSNEEFMRSGGRKRNKSIELAEKKIEKGIDLRVLVVAGGGR